MCSKLLSATAQIPLEANQLKAFQQIVSHLCDARGVKAFGKNILGRVQSANDICLAFND
jgi:hypothetical protein